MYAKRLAHLSSTIFVEFDRPAFGIPVPFILPKKE
jgi:hypothetical protein